MGDHAVAAGLAVGDVDHVGQQIQDGEVVLDHHDVPRLAHALDQLRAADALVNVKIRGDLVEEVEPGVPHGAGRNGDTLQLAAGQLGDLPVQQRGQAQLGGHLVHDAALVGFLQQVADLALERFRDEIDVLWLLGGLDLLAGDGPHVVLQLRAGEILDHVFPLRVLAAEVGHHLPGEYLDRRGLADAVLAQEAADPAVGRLRQPVEREAVLAVAVGELVFEPVRQADDHDRLVGALLDADAAADAELLGNDRLAVLPHDDGLVAAPHLGAVLDALLGALPGLAAVFFEDGNSHGHRLPQSMLKRYQNNGPKNGAGPFRSSVHVTNQKQKVMKDRKNQSLNPNRFESIPR